ncbi:hypothetical protein OROMI_013885 [Orobanche minor]
MYHDARNDDDEEVVSDGKLMEDLENGPTIGTIECFEGYYDEYKGKGIYTGPFDEPYYVTHTVINPSIHHHAVIVTGYLGHPQHGLVFECVTKNDNFEETHVGYVARHLFIAMENIESVARVLS